MKTGRRITITVFGTTCGFLFCTPLFAAVTNPLSNFAPEWAISATNTARFDHYSVTGAMAGSPFPFTGYKEFDALDLNFSKAVSSYEFKRIQAGVLFNNSKYRAFRDGVMVERFNALWEKGDARLPFRGEVGDFFGYFSYRTLQRNLKGGRLELQPVIRKLPGGHSLVVLAGVNEPFYRNFKDNDEEGNREQYVGGSWLWDVKDEGMYAVNVVQQSQRKSKLVTEHNFGHVFSVVGERQLSAGDQRLTLEGEVAHFSGHRRTSASNKAGDGGSMGYYLDLTGRDNLEPITYQLALEWYGDDYRPIGGVVTPDRRSLVSSAAWRFESGLKLRGRLQGFRDDVDGANPLITKTAGISLQGPIALKRVPGFNVAYDGTVRELKNKSSTQNQVSYNNILTLGAPFAKVWNAYLNLYHQKLDDSRTGGSTRKTAQAQFSVSRSFSFKGVEGVVTPGVMGRKILGGASKTTDWGPSLGLGVTKGPHALNANYNTFSFKRDLPGAEDLVSHAFAFAYSCLLGQHRFGLDAEFFNRRPDGRQKTNSHRMGLFYTYSFDRPARVLAGHFSPAIASVGVAPQKDSAFLLTQLTLGRPITEAQTVLENHFIKDGHLQAGNSRVYETQMLAEIDLRQRLVLMEAGGNLRKAAIIIDFDGVGGSDTALQSFERVRRALLRKFGQPMSTVEEGNFTANFVDDINSNQLIRVAEWPTPEGVVRLGIPHRLDRAVRMEVHFAKELPDVRQTYWSIEGVAS